MTKKKEFSYVDAVEMLTRYLPIKGGVWAMTERVMSGEEQKEPSELSRTIAALFGLAK